MSTGTLRRYHALRHQQAVVDDTPTHFVQPTTPPQSAPVATDAVAQQVVKDNPVVNASKKAKST